MNARAVRHAGTVVSKSSSALIAWWGVNVFVACVTLERIDPAVAVACVTLGHCDHQAMDADWDLPSNGASDLPTSRRARI